MKSQERPCSTSAKTSATVTRVPLKVGRPRQIFGSETMYCPSALAMATFIAYVCVGRNCQRRRTQCGGTSGHPQRISLHERFFGVPFGDFFGGAERGLEDWA